MNAGVAEGAVLRGAGLPRVAPAESAPFRPGQRAWFGGFSVLRRLPVLLSARREFPRLPEPTADSEHVLERASDGRPTAGVKDIGEPALDQRAAPAIDAARHEVPVARLPARAHTELPRIASLTETREAPVSVMRSISQAATPSTPAASDRQASTPSAGSAGGPPVQGPGSPLHAVVRSAEIDAPVAAFEAVAESMTPMGAPAGVVARHDVGTDPSDVRVLSPPPPMSDAAGVPASLVQAAAAGWTFDEPSREDDASVQHAPERVVTIQHDSREDVMGKARLPRSAPVLLDAQVTTQLTVLRELLQERAARRARRIEIGSVHVSVTPPPPVAAPREPLPAAPLPVMGGSGSMPDFIDPWLSADVVFE